MNQLDDVDIPSCNKTPTAGHFCRPWCVPPIILITKPGLQKPVISLSLFVQVHNLSPLPPTPGTPPLLYLRERGAQDSGGARERDSQ
ncbi:unnamed protein product [Hydatigera taeniaeformis]|uniref:Uncharacterized protein n=1 Tax=Hydatigena taeniaeformis TaxID=6205 RepID=A0A0R3XBU5_HYDTA|nr:unnamed protein product [Hydatigera taeniaeformis]